jgi:hypothetical protein
MMDADAEDSIAHLSGGLIKFLLFHRPARVPCAGLFFQPINASAQNGLSCVAGAIASAMISATVPSMRWVALRLSGARLPLASVRIVVCDMHIDSTGLS